MQRGIFKQAEKCFLDILKIGPEIIEVQTALAFVYAASNQHSKAATAFKSILKYNPGDAHSHHNLGNSLYELKLYEDAISHYETATKINPNLVDSYTHCGLAHRMLKNYDSAIKYLKKSLDLDKKNAKAYQSLGVVYADIEDFPRALECLENATGLAPENAAYRVGFANVLEKVSLDYEAGIQYHRACETDPNYLDGFTLYSTYLNERHRYDEALECLSRAEQLSPGNLDILDQFGQSYLGMGNAEAALERFNAALKIEPNRLTSLRGKEKVFQETGNLDAAIETCEQIIKLDSSQPTGYILKSRIKKFNSEDSITDDLLAYLANDKLDSEMRIDTNFALGKVFDDQNKYEQAIKYYAAGNDLKNGMLNYDPQKDEDNFSKLIDVFNADLFKQSQQVGSESNLPVLIVGMPRSGTTLTEQIISSHPSVQGAGEVDFWHKANTAMPFRMNTDTPYPECIAELTSKHARDIAGMYESTLRKIVGPSSAPIKHITDKMPHNFLSVGLIALLFPNVKIIHTKRDPIDTCLSIYFQNFNEFHNYAFNLTNLGKHYRQYQRLMQHWHNVLPGRIMDINYEDTIADPEYWSRQLISHIGLEWNDACLSPHKLERSVKTASHWQVRQPIYKTSVQRWKHYEPYLEPLKQALYL